MRSSFIFGISSAVVLVIVGVLGFFFVAYQSNEAESSRTSAKSIAQSASEGGLRLVPEAEPAPVVIVPATVTTSLLFVGDIMLDRTVQTRTIASKNPNYPFAKLPLGWLGSFDYTVGNLEGPVTDKRRPPEKSIDFIFEPSWLPILKSLGIDAFSQANNHALDQGRLGASDSSKRLTDSGFLHFGDQVDDGDIALATTTVGETRIAFLGWNTTDNPIVKKDAEAVMKKAKEQSDLVIAYLHWGSEYRAQPDKSSVEMAHWLIDQGINVVVGGHPHWSQGVSTYKGKPIVWSLGNFVFDQDWSEETRYGLAASLELVEKEVVAINLYPLRIDLSQPRLLENNQKRLRLEELAKRSDADLADAVRSGRILVK